MTEPLERDAAAMGATDTSAQAPGSHSGADPEAPHSLNDVPNADGAIAWAMVEASPDALIMTDDHGVIELVNGQAEKLFGYNRVEMLGRPVEMLLPERLAQAHTAHRTRFRAAPEVRAMGSGLNLRARRADGSELPVEVSLSPLDVQGELRVIATVRDISERVAAEAQQHLIQRTIDAVHDGVFMFPADGEMTFIYANQGAIDQTGYTRDELLAMTPLHIKPEFTRASFLDAVEPLIKDEVPRVVLQTVHRRKDGRDVPVEIILEYPAASTSTAQRFMIALVRDITAHVEATALVQRSEARFRAAFTDGPVAMTLTEVSPTSDRIIMQANQAMADLVGYSTDELLQMSVIDFGHPDDRDADDEWTAAQLSGLQESFAGRKRYIHKDGSVIWVQLHVRVLKREGERITTIGNSIDITAEVEAERLRAQNQSVLEALSDVRAALLAEAPIGEVLTRVCGRTRGLVDADTVMFSQPDNAHDEVHVVAYSGEQVPRSFTIDGPLRAALDGRPWRSDDIAEAVDVDQTNRSSGGEIAGPAMLVPVGVSGKTAGVLMVGRDHGADPFDDEALHLIIEFAASASTALQLDEARRGKKKVELLEDRERIGRDMHDKVISRLFATGMTVQAASIRMPDEESRDRLTSVVDELDDSIKEIRNTIYGLRSQVDWGKGARGEILACAAEQNAPLGFEPRVNLVGPIDDLPEPIVDSMLATIREALSNSAKYANATSVSVDVSVDLRELVTSVADNGIGFQYDPDSAVRDDHTGNGLRNIVSRAEALNGWATISSEPGTGTTVTWSCPLDEAMYDLEES